MSIYDKQRKLENLGYSFNYSSYGIMLYYLGSKIYEKHLGRYISFDYIEDANESAKHLLECGIVQAEKHYHSTIE